MLDDDDDDEALAEDRLAVLLELSALGRLPEGLLLLLVLLLLLALLLPVLPDRADFPEGGGGGLEDDESSFFSLCFFPIFNLIMVCCVETSK